jgi:hypothetical protein
MKKIHTVLPRNLERVDEPDVVGMLELLRRRAIASIEWGRQHEHDIASADDPRWCTVPWAERLLPRLARLEGALDRQIRRANA